MVAKIDACSEMIVCDAFLALSVLLIQTYDAGTHDIDNDSSSLLTVYTKDVKCEKGCIFSATAHCLCQS